jgi:hypothetical protein
MIAAAGTERFVRIQNACKFVSLRSRLRPIWFLLTGPCWVRKGPSGGLEKLGFPWILSSEASLFNGLRGNFVGEFFGVVRRRVDPIGRLKIVDETVDLVEQPLPFFRAVIVFRHDRHLVPVEPVDHLDERSDRLELSARDRFSDAAKAASAVRAADARCRRRGR